MNRLIYRRRRACFACGKLTGTACTGHEYGGTITAWQVRPWARLLGLPWVFGGAR